MPKIEQIFARTEVKYVITAKQRAALLSRIGPHIQPDAFGKSTVCSLYFDTDDFRLIRDSLDKPLYKEKVRLRCYGVPQENSAVFLELKKKFCGVVYKRRETTTLREAETYLLGGRLPRDSQIMREFDWMMRTYALKPAALVCGEREAFFSADEGSVRITFDSALRFRTENMAPSKGTAGTAILPAGIYILEIKASAMPLWLADALDELKIYPSNFSKYGTVYEKHIRSCNTCSTHYSSRSSRTASQPAPISSAR